MSTVKAMSALHYSSLLKEDVPSEIYLMHRPTGQFNPHVRIVCVCVDAILSLAQQNFRCSSFQLWAG